MATKTMRYELDPPKLDSASLTVSCSHCHRDIEVAEWAWRGWDNMSWGYFCVTCVPMDKEV